MDIKINLNESVRFKLSERGKEIYRHRYDRYGFEYDREPKLDDDGYMSMQLWAFMQTFGEHMILGASEVLNPLEIIYENEDESEDNKTLWFTEEVTTPIIMTLKEWQELERKIRCGAETVTATDCISRQQAVGAWDKLSKRGRTEFDQVLMTLPSATPTEQQNKEKEHDGKSICHTCATNNCPFQYGIYRNNCDFYTSVNKLRNAPSVIPTERTGEWKHTMTRYPYCSECEWMPEEDEMTHGRYKYCPNCGARMKG